MLAHLNAWFGIVGEVVEAHGGEVLKFIGDAVLAIFPTSDEQDRRAACRKALAAAQEFVRRTDAENDLRRSAGTSALVHGLALHVGEVAYGNVGAPHRLDFTVIGPAVNRASRLLDLAKRLDQQVLVSQALAREVEPAPGGFGAPPVARRREAAAGLYIAQPRQCWIALIGTPRHLPPLSTC